MAIPPPIIPGPIPPLPIPAPPMIAVQIVAWMITSSIKANTAAALAAKQYDYFQTLLEAQITELAIKLGQLTDMIMEDWFVILRSIQDHGIFMPTPDIPVPDVPVPDVPGTTDGQPTPSWVWYGLAGLGGLLLISAAPRRT